MRQFTVEQIDEIARKSCVDRGTDPDEMTYMPRQPGEQFTMGGPNRPMVPRWQVEREKVIQVLEQMRVMQVVQNYEALLNIDPDFHRWCVTGSSK